jgi:lipoyl(octanoyl) transferase
VKLEDWGLIDYEASVNRQADLVEEISGGAEERVIFCNHPPVVTLGRGASSEDLIGWTGHTIESTRGGRATYHGPNQLVIYPVLNLGNSHRDFKSHDLHAYLRALENATLCSIREAGLPAAEVRTAKVGGVSLTGVWIGDKKVASIGIAVRKWVTYHGVAINVLHDESAFRGIRPCGFEPGIMTSMEQELGRTLDKASIQEIFQRVFSSVLG